MHEPWYKSRPGTISRCTRHKLILSKRRTMEQLIRYIAILALVYAVTAQGSTKQDILGYTKPLENFPVSSCEEGVFVADHDNRCWYWECVRVGERSMELQPRACPLGVAVEYTFTAGRSSPCTFAYHGRSHYFECTRERDIRIVNRPYCTTQLTCKNGGELKTSGDTCWCECPAGWQGDSDCSRRTNPNPDEPIARTLCPNGVPERDHCRDAGGCLNGGICHNQCGGFWCECKSPYRFGKRCERFSCERPGECLNDGVCERGNTDMDEIRVCKCVAGTFGKRCEVDLRPKTTANPQG